MIKFIPFFVIFLIANLILHSADGDTMKIRTIEFGKPKYGWFDFPDSNKSFQKILLNYKIKCPCEEWDYLAMVFILQFFAPSFRVDSTVFEQFSFMNDTSWYYTAKIIDNKLMIDSLPQKPRLIEFYDDIHNPTQRTSYRYVWDTYYRYTFDNQGNKIDSIFVPPDSTIYLKKRRIYINHPIAITERYEIMRYITPYGIGLDVGDGFTWIIDVTDFAPLLIDKVYIDAPNTQQAIEITFDFIEGIPERRVKKIHRLFDFYSVIYDKNFESKISAKQIQISPDEKMARLKVIQTGHGFGGNEDNCCEFCKKQAFVKVDDNQIYSRWVWRLCSENALYPQGGTWLFNRSNWCPGAEVQPFDFELTPYILGKRSFFVDYDMEYYDKPYTSGNNTAGNWLITAYVITYGDLNFKLDAEITDIIAPSDKDIYKRLNPTSTKPIIVIRNRGSERIKQMTIRYGIIGANEYEYKWEGNLASFESDTINLPALDCSDWNVKNNIFKAEIININNQNDEYPFNNIGYSKFNKPPSFYENLKIILRTNNYNVLTNNPDLRPYSYQILDSKSNIVFQRNDFLPSNLYIDSINLEEGCYEFKFFNEFECGLGFWFYNRIFNLTTGSLQITSDNLVHFNPQPDFGYSIYTNFRTDKQQTVSFSPDTLNFGFVKINSKKTKEVIIKPKNNKGLTVWDFKIILGERRGFAIEEITPNPNEDNRWNLSANDSISVKISFNPTKIGESATSLTFFSGDLKNPMVSISLIGIGDDGSFINEDNLEILLISQNDNIYEFNVNKSAFNSTNVEVYNIIGKLLYQQQIANNKLRLDMTGFDTGLYFIRFYNLAKNSFFPIFHFKK